MSHGSKIDFLLFLGWFQLSEQRTGQPRQQRVLPGWSIMVCNKLSCLAVPGASPHGVCTADCWLRYLDLSNSNEYKYLTYLSIYGCRMFGNWYLFGQYLNESVFSNFNVSKFFHFLFPFCLVP